MHVQAMLAYIMTIVLLLEQVMYTKAALQTTAVLALIYVIRAGKLLEDIKKVLGRVMTVILAAGLVDC